MCFNEAFLGNALRAKLRLLDIQIGFNDWLPEDLIPARLITQSRRPDAVEFRWRAVGDRRQFT
jgi:hypothetical protein